MSLRVGSRASSPRPILELLLLGLLLLPAALAQDLGADPEEGGGDLQCVCVRTISGVHPKFIASLEVIGPGRHCPTSQMIATLKNGRKICLDPHSPMNKKIIKKLTEKKLAN